MLQYLSCLVYDDINCIEMRTIVMNEKVLQTLEYNKIIEQLVTYAASPSGREACRTLKPQTDSRWIETAQRETSDALTHILTKGELSFYGIEDIRPALKRLEIGSSLGSHELLDIAKLLSAAGSVKNYFRQSLREDDSTGDSLDERYRLIEPLSLLMQEIRRCIPDEDNIADDASTGLAQIRRQLKLTNDRIHEQLSSIVNGSARSMLQDSIITMRNGRYCLPVKAEYRSSFRGMLHDQSATGSTLFIEPAAIVKLNNDIRQLELKEQEEIDKILADLSNLAAEQSFFLAQNYRVLCELDFIFARAMLSKHMRGTRPIFPTEGYIEIKKGRHPLIDPKKVVPIDIHIGRDFSLLVVTGPNTGGKTVSLKTVGLFCLMGQAGLHIPAFDNSCLKIFDEIYADIGDEQSIEQSLSTFSSHMVNTVSILERADADSLVLFDELGAGTDPTEGAALATAILSNLHKRGCLVMATTHYSELKLYALQTPDVQNACCEFDVATLAPTYRLLIGIPGKSNAFAISGKLGLPQYIIDDAKESLASEDVAFEDVISDLEKSRVTIEREKLELEEYKKEVEDLKNQLKAKNERLDERSDNILQKAREEASAILREAKETADDAIRKLNKANAAGMSVTELEKQRQRINDNINKVDKGRVIKSQAPARQHKASDFHIGDRVHVASLNLDGTVHTLPNQKGELNVTIGIMNYNVNMSDLTIIEEASEMRKLKQKSSGIGKLKMSKTASISPEINLIGMTSDEAIMTLDKYLDDAFLSHISPVRIVHGKGSGILRNAVHNYLKRQKHVKSFRLGSFGEGDYGVTIVEFKD